MKGKDSEDFYAKSSVVDGVHKVSKELGTSPRQGLDDFRNKKIFDFGFSDPTKIDFKDGTRTLELSVRRQVDVEQQDDEFDYRPGAGR